MSRVHAHNLGGAGSRPEGEGEGEGEVMTWLKFFWILIGMNELKKRQARGKNQWPSKSKVTKLPPPHTPIWSTFGLFLTNFQCKLNFSNTLLIYEHMRRAFTKFWAISWFRKKTAARWDIYHWPTYLQIKVLPLLHKATSNFFFHSLSVFLL